MVLAVKDQANNPYHLVSERQVDHREVCPAEDRSTGLQKLADFVLAGIGATIWHVLHLFGL